MHKLSVFHRVATQDACFKVVGLKLNMTLTLLTNSNNQDDDYENDKTLPYSFLQLLPKAVKRQNNYFLSRRTIRENVPLAAHEISEKSLHAYSL